MANVLKVNQQMIIMLSKKPGSQQFKSRIEEVNDDNIVCAMPMVKSYPLTLSLGTKIYCKVIVDGIIYLFVSKIINKKMLPIPIWIIEIPKEMERIQQREFVRIDALLSVQATKIVENKPVETIKAATKDLSGGGIRLILNKPLEPDDNLLLEISLPDGDIITSFGEVVRTEQPDSSRDLYWIGVKFLNIPENMRNKLIKFIFRKQLEQRQKGRN